MRRLVAINSPHFGTLLALLLAAALATALLVLVETKPAGAAFPGQNGKIAFVSSRDGGDNIFVMGSNGSNPTNLTNNRSSDYYPDWGVVVNTPPNTPPVATNDSYSVNQDQTLNVPASSGVLANDTDAESDPLTAVKASDPSHGTLTLNSDGSFTYTPNSGFSGSDSFTYKANDGKADSNVVSVTITVQPDTTPPTVVSVNPSEGQTGVGRATNITVTFSARL